MTGHLAILLLFLFAFAGCDSPVRWQHPDGCDKSRLRKEIQECRALARDMTNEHRKTIKIPGSSPHGGVAEALLMLAMHEEFFESCLSSRGWTKKQVE